MTKLTKAPPPAYSGKITPPGSLGAAVPYENLPQGTMQPVPVTTAVTPSTYNELPATNPFSPNFVAGPVSPNVHPAPFSPVSPIESRPVERLSQAPVQAPRPQRPDAAQRRSVDLRRLDGKPYPGSSPPDKEKPRVVKVARDMHDGALPPVYKRQASDPINPTEVSHALANGHECGTCGKKRGEGQGCTHCGKRKASAPASTTAASAAPRSHGPPSHGRVPSEGAASHGSRLSESTAGPSSSTGSTNGTRCCAKCGRYKRPGSLPMSHNPFDQGRPNGSGPATAPIPLANHPALRGPGLSLQPNLASSGPSFPKIDIIPPSASTYKAVNSPFSNYGDDSPLVGNATKQEFKLFRNSSLVRSLSRRLSKKDKNVAAPLPSQQLAATGEQSTETLINRISVAMQGTASDRDSQYYQLDAGDRPQTPFSFVGGRDEEDAFEMVNIRDQGSVSSHDSLKQVVVVEPEIKVTHSDLDYSAIPQDTIDVIPRPKSAEGNRQHLTVDDAEQRPQITRFKSLRQGVSRMGSVSRSTSLKRLGSLKTVHHAWYRDDMAIEGANANENAVPVF